MPNESKRELIQSNMKTEFEAIAAGDKYHNTVGKGNVLRRFIHPSEIKKGMTPRIGIGVGRESVLRTLGGEPPKYRKSLPVFVWGWVFSDQREETQTYVERLVRDVVIKAFEDRTHGTNACGTYLEGVDTDTGVLALKNVGGFEAEFRIEYDMVEDEP